MGQPRRQGVARQVSPSPFDVPRRRLVVTFPQGSLSQPFDTLEELTAYVRALAPMIHEADAAWHVTQP